MKKSTGGFTIVELLIVIVVIGVLAAIVVVAYNGITSSANWTQVLGNLKTVDKALAVYHTRNGSYPVSPGSTWIYSCQSGITNFIPELSTVIGSIPQAPCQNASSTSDTWIYRSDGTNYKLMQIRPDASIASHVPAALQDFRYTASQPTWGYWTAGGAAW